MFGGMRMYENIPEEGWIVMHWKGCSSHSKKFKIVQQRGMNTGSNPDTGH